MTNETNVTILPPEGKKITKSYQRVIKQEIPRYWNREEINEKLNQITNYKHKMFLTFLWMSGVRITEAVNLQKKDIDFKNFIMKIKWLKSRKYNERIVPIHPRLKEVLELYSAPMNLEAHVFPFTRQQGWQIAKKWADGNPHKFRHSFAVNWLRSDGDIVTLHRILGHANIQTTMIYLRIVPLDQGKELMKIKFD